MEIESVNMQEKVLHIWVWIKAPVVLRYFHQTLHQLVVRPVREVINDYYTSKQEMLDLWSNMNDKYCKFLVSTFSFTVI